MKEKLVIIDGNSIFYRSFYALPLLTNVKGEYSNAIYGFANEIIKVITEMKPTHLLVAFDVSKKTFRNDIYPEYKATRKPMPTELASQIEPLKQMLTLMGIKMLEKQGLEADDIIGTIAKRFNVDTLILTGDRDSFQLIDETTYVCFMKKGLSEVKIMTEANLKDEYGVFAEQVVDLKALQGDTADNIPGVAGVGPKTAIDLIEKYGSLDGVYNHIDEIKGKLQEKLIANKEMAYISQKLARINTEVDIACTLEDCTYDFPFTNELKSFFANYNIRSITKREELYKSNEGNPEISVREEKADVYKISDLNEIDEIVKRNKKSQISLMIDKMGLLHFSFGDVDYTHDATSDLFTLAPTKEEILLRLKPVIENPQFLKVFLNTKDFLHLFDKIGIKLDNNIFDVAIATNLSEGIVVKFYEDCFEYFNFSLESPAVSIMRMSEILRKEIENKNLQKAYYEVEIPLIFTLFNMEMRGFKVDTKKLKALEKQYMKSLDLLEQQIYEVVGHEFNLNSPKQLASVLFDELKLPKSSKLSTNVEVLESMAHLHEVIPLILEYRKNSKIYGTYLTGLKVFVDKNDLIHTNFNQTLTATGRLSSSEPNLQNLPIRNEEGRMIRSIFTASSEDNVLIDSDYSQIELRVLAHVSHDDFYINAFANNEDIHKKTACQVFNLPPELITDRMRRIAKVVNFGVVYGISQFGLSTDLKITIKEAKEYIESFYKLHPNIEEYMKKEVETTKERGYAKTMLGRIRKIPDITSTNYMIRTRAERVAQNLNIQGSAAEIIKIAMNNVEKRLTEGKFKARLIMQVHDELVVDCPKSEEAEVSKLVKHEMDNAVSMLVPLVTEVETAYRWGDAH